MAKQMPKRNLEKVGLGVTGACVVLVTLVVLALIIMVAQKGLSAFFKDGVNIAGFFGGTKWDLSNTDQNGMPYTGALPLIVTSFSVTILSTIIALPVSLGSAIFAVEIRPRFGSKVFQPLIELLTGIPSVVFGLIGFHVVVGACKAIFGVSTGLGILPGSIVLAVMILPTVTTLSIDALRAVPDNLFGIAKDDLFIEMLDALDSQPASASVDIIKDRVATMSCKAAVKGNHRLSVSEVHALIDELMTLENPYHCPHGRPTIISMSKYEIEKKFKRIV